MNDEMLERLAKAAFPDGCTIRILHDPERSKERFVAVWPPGAPKGAFLQFIFTMSDSLIAELLEKAVTSKLEEYAREFALGPPQDRAA